MKGTRADPKEGDGKQRHNSKEVFGICPVSHFCYMYNLFCPHAQGNLSHPNYPYCNIFAIPLLQHHCLMLKNTPVLFSSGSAVIRTRSPLNLADMPAEGGTRNCPVFRRLPWHPGVIIMSVEGIVSQEALGKARMKWGCSWDVIDVLWVDEARLGSWGPPNPATSGSALRNRLGSGHGPACDSLKKFKRWLSQCPTNWVIG